MAAKRRDDDEGDLQFPIDEKWRLEVIKALGTARGAKARMAKGIGCSPGTLNELLSKGVRSEFVPKIHAYLGWDPPPMPVTGSTDQHEIEVFLKKMGRSGRSIFEHLRTIGENDPSQLQAVEAIVAALAKKPANR